MFDPLLMDSQECLPDTSGRFYLQRSAQFDRGVLAVIIAELWP